MASKAVGDFPVKGKIVLITGGGSGIGLAFTKLCHSRGAKVLIGDLKLTAEAKELLETNKDDGLAFGECDVTKWSTLKDLITTSVKVFGEVPDIYVPCAGVFEPPWSNFWDDTEDHVGSYLTMRINADHPMKLTRLAIRALLGADKKGVVCLVASGAGLAGVYLAATYCASKHAVVGLAKCLGETDNQEGVKVVCICPGMVASPLWTDRRDERAKMFHFNDNTVVLTAEDTAETMVRLVEEGKYLGGTVLVKMPEMEMVVEKGGQEGKDEHGRELGDFQHVKDVLAKERGVPWQS